MVKDKREFLEEKKIFYYGFFSNSIDFMRKLR